MFCKINKEQITKDIRPINNLKQKTNNLTNIEWALCYTIQTAENWGKEKLYFAKRHKSPFYNIATMNFVHCATLVASMYAVWCKPKMQDTILHCCSKNLEI